ncbi:MAG: hypothetical protein ABSA16_00920 [Thermoguttaceae bacterium]|jgi:hypothetical protein
MLAHNDNKRLAEEHSVTSLKILALHLTWFILGPVALFVSILSIVSAGTNWLSVRDIVFYGVVALMIFARWVDQKSGQGTTSEGKPSTWKDFQQYVVILSAFAVGAWLMAKAFGYWFVVNKTFF